MFRGVGSYQDRRSAASRGMRTFSSATVDTVERSLAGRPPVAGIPVLVAPLRLMASSLSSTAGPDEGNDAIASRRGGSCQCILHLLKRLTFRPCEGRRALSTAEV